MTLTDFWVELKKGGVTAKGYTYEVLPDGRLKITSPKAKGVLLSLPETVEAYFNKLDGGMNPADFSYHHSAWFRNVYEAIV